MTPHEEIARLRNRIADLEAEITFVRDQSEGAAATLGLAFSLSPQEAAVLEVLYRAKGKVVSAARMVDMLPNKFRTEDCDEHAYAAVYIYKLRHKLGRTAVLTSWGQGFCLSSNMQRECDAALQPVGLAA